MNRQFSFLLGLGLIAVPAVLRADILVNLNPTTAFYDGGKSPRVNPAPPTPMLTSGFTYNISFTPTANDLIGLVNLMELGGTGAGTALFLSNGVPVFVSKMTSNQGTQPESMPDLIWADTAGGVDSFQVVAAASSFGLLTAGSSYSYSLSWNHQINGVFQLGFKDNINPLSLTVDSYTTAGNPFGWAAPGWVGNNSLTIGMIPTLLDMVTPAPAHFAGTTTAAGSFWHTSNLKALEGTVERALYWNEVGVVPEPSAAALGGLGMLLLLFRRRRQ